ncbi:TPA: hypothetical protein QEL68_000721 [Stenotrophomonas maltophilia]|nr:hypothetical protein [Stenotrophomonas maltophilia]
MMFPLSDVLAGISPEPVSLRALLPDALNLTAPRHLVYVSGYPVAVNVR